MKEKLILLVSMVIMSTHFFNRTASLISLKSSILHSSCSSRRRRNCQSDVGFHIKELQQFKSCVCVATQAMLTALIQAYSYTWLVFIYTLEPLTLSSLKIAKAFQYSRWSISSRVKFQFCWYVTTSLLKLSHSYRVFLKHH